MGGRKAGWRISQDDLNEFVQSRKTGATEANSDQTALDAFDREQGEELEAFQAEQEQRRNDFIAGQKG